MESVRSKFISGHRYSDCCSTPNVIANKRRTEYHKTKDRTHREVAYSKWIIFVRRIFSERGLPTYTEVDVKGGRLRGVLEELLRNAKNFAFKDAKGTIPPRLFFHAFTGLNARLTAAQEAEPNDDELVQELKAGIQYVKEDFSETFSALETLLPKNQITWDLLWAIFPPGEAAVGFDKLAHLQAYSMRETEYGKRPDGSRFFSITADTIDHEGARFGWVRHNLMVEEFQGVVGITDLAYWPLVKHPEEQRIRKQLCSAGGDALKLHGRMLVNYDGHGLYEVERHDKIVAERYLPHGRIMLDPATFYSVHPENVILPRIQSPYFQYRPEPTLLLYVSQLLYGFSLGDKTWGAFAVQQVRELTWNHSAFDSLVLERERKEFLKDLVLDHLSPGQSEFDDFVKGKGRGLIGILSGAPGTLTAEAIAETTKRPMYIVSSGELGNTPCEILDRLKSIMLLTEIWDAVLLLDEADVFLAERGDDLARNAIISIFLRELEYYQGIMILTTNRLNAIDAAFQSRIHFGLQYPNLDEGSRAIIWKNFVTQTSNLTSVKTDISNDDVTQLAKLDLNGRQIKNAMSVSQAVARRRGQPLNRACIKSALGLSQHIYAALHPESNGAR